ncbi:unnamed protein product [Parajaminaea phylloscopi]
MAQATLYPPSVGAQPQPGLQPSRRSQPFDGASSPGPASPHSALDVIVGRPPREAIASYLVSTETDSLQDLRLQITACESGSKGRARDARKPPRPLYFRERTLTEEDEIVDRLIDSASGSAIWTIHRPTRGWYLHIRSPALPPGFAIPLRPARPDFVTSTMGVQDPGSTPLTFTLTTRVDRASLRHCKTWIKEVEDDAAGARASTSTTEAAGASDFLAVNLDARRDPPPTNDDHADTSSSPPHTRNIESDSRRTHTARTSSVSSSAQPGDPSVQTHARRRSSGRTLGSGPDTRMSFSGHFEGVAEIQEEEGEVSTGGDGRGQPASSSHLTSSSSTAPIDGPAAAAGQKPLQCYFLLLDGAARVPPPAAGAIFPLAPGRIAESSQRLGWARWIWSLVPDPVRPPLSFDTTKSFSVRWLEAPSDEDVGRQGTPSPSNGTAGGDQTRSIEVLRYEDEGESGWSFFDSRTRGKFVFQEDAIRALGVDRGFWIAVGLAYLEFLEERDGYNAASGG